MAGSYTRQDAERALGAWLDELGRVPAIRELVTFEHAARTWLDYIEHDRKRRPSTVREYRNILEYYLLPAFDSQPLHRITTEDVDNWRASLVAEGRLSDRTVNKLLAQMRGIFKRGQRLYGLNGNPAAGADRQPHRPHGDIEVLDPGDVLLLAAHTGDAQDAAIVTVAAFTGLRLGELLALLWRDVDFAKRLVHVRWSYVMGHEDRAKSHRARSVPLIDQAAKALDGA